MILVNAAYLPTRTKSPLWRVYLTPAPCQLLAASLAGDVEVGITGANAAFSSLPPSASQWAGTTPALCQKLVAQHAGVAMISASLQCLLPPLPTKFPLWRASGTPVLYQWQANPHAGAATATVSLPFRHSPLLTKLPSRHAPCTPALYQQKVFQHVGEAIAKGRSPCLRFLPPVSLPWRRATNTLAPCQHMVASAAGGAIVLVKPPCRLSSFLTKLLSRQVVCTPVRYLQLVLYCVGALTHTARPPHLPLPSLALLRHAILR